MTTSDQEATPHPLDALLSGGVKIEWDGRYHDLDPEKLRFRYKTNGDPLILKNYNAVVHGLPNDTYHAERDHLSSSSLKQFVKNPRKYKRLFVDKHGEEEPEDDKEFLAFGSLVHCILLEPDSLDDHYVVFEEGPDGKPWNPRTKLHRSWHEVIQRKTGKLYFHESDFAEAMECANEVLANQTAVDLLNGTDVRHRELSLFCCERENMIRIKAKLDLLLMYEGRPTIVDIKTTSKDCSPEGFSTTLARLGYDISAAVYCIAFRIVTGVTPRFIWIAVERDKDGDHQCIVHELTHEDMMLAIDEVRHHLQDLTLAHFAEFQSPYHNKINRVTIPAWRFRERRQ